MGTRRPGSRHRLERPASAADKRSYKLRAWIHQHREAAQGVPEEERRGTQDGGLRVQMRKARMLIPNPNWPALDSSTRASSITLNGTVGTALSGVDSSKTIQMSLTSPMATTTHLPHCCRDRTDTGWASCFRLLAAPRHRRRPRKSWAYHPIQPINAASEDQPLRPRYTAAR